MPRRQARKSEWGFEVGSSSLPGGRERGDGAPAGEGTAPGIEAKANSGNLDSLDACDFDGMALKAQSGPEFSGHLVDLEELKPVGAGVESCSAGSMNPVSSDPFDDRSTNQVSPIASEEVAVHSGESVPSETGAISPMNGHNSFPGEPIAGAGDFPGVTDFDGSDMDTQLAGLTSPPVEKEEPASDADLFWEGSGDSQDDFLPLEDLPSESVGAGIEVRRDYQGAQEAEADCKIGVELDDWEESEPFILEEPEKRQAEEVGPIPEIAEAPLESLPETERAEEEIVDVLVEEAELPALEEVFPLLDSGGDSMADSEPEQASAEEEKEKEQTVDREAETLEVMCPDCRKELSLRREFLGVEGACVWCQTPIVAAACGLSGEVRVFRIAPESAPPENKFPEPTPRSEETVASPACSRPESLELPVQESVGKPDLPAASVEREPEPEIAAAEIERAEPGSGIELESGIEPESDIEPEKGPDHKPEATVPVEGGELIENGFPAVEKEEADPFSTAENPTTGQVLPDPLREEKSKLGDPSARAERRHPFRDEVRQGPPSRQRPLPPPRNVPEPVGKLRKSPMDVIRATGATSAPIGEGERPDAAPMVTGGLPEPRTVEPKAEEKPEWESESHAESIPESVPEEDTAGAHGPLLPPRTEVAVETVSPSEPLPEVSKVVEAPYEPQWPGTSELPGLGDSTVQSASLPVEEKPGSPVLDEIASQPDPFVSPDLGAVSAESGPEVETVEFEDFRAPGDLADFFAPEESETKEIGNLVGQEEASSEPEIPETLGAGDSLPAPEVSQDLFPSEPEDWQEKLERQIASAFPPPGQVAENPFSDSGSIFESCDDSPGNEDSIFTSRPAQLDSPDPGGPESGVGFGGIPSGPLAPPTETLPRQNDISAAEPDSDSEAEGNGRGWLAGAILGGFGLIFGVGAASVFWGDIIDTFQTAVTEQIENTGSTEWPPAPDSEKFSKNQTDSTVADGMPSPPPELPDSVPGAAPVPQILD